MADELNARQRTSHLIDKSIERIGTLFDGPKQDRSRQRITQIFDAATKIFARDGISAARIADIAAEASVMPASIYDYFKSKEDLAYSIPVTRQLDFFIEYRDQSQSLHTARERLDHFLWLSADFVFRNAEWARVFYLEIWPSVHIEKREIQPIFDDYAHIVICLLREGEESGEWPVQADIHTTANILIGSVNQTIITWLLYRQPRNLRQATRVLLQWLIGFVCSQHPAATTSPLTLIRKSNMTRNSQGGATSTNTAAPTNSSDA